MRESTREGLKAFALLAIIIAGVCFLMWVWNNIDVNSPGMRAVIENAPQTRHENGYKIVTIGGVDYISTDDGNGGERLTPMIKKETQE